MFKNKAFLAALTALVIVGLTACGGGSSSGGGSGGPAPTAFAGRYEGGFSVTIQGITQSTALIITVGPMGLVTIYLPNVTPSACVANTQPNSPYLAGNRIGFSGSGSCFDPNLGTCQVSIKGQIVFSAGNAVGDGTFHFVCPAGTFDGTLGIGAKKVS